MVRRRSTVRFRKVALQLEELFRTCNRVPHPPKGAIRVALATLLSLPEQGVLGGLSESLINRRAGLYLFCLAGAGLWEMRRAGSMILICDDQEEHGARACPDAQFPVRRFDGAGHCESLSAIGVPIPPPWSARRAA